MPDLASLIELAGTGNEFFYNGLLGGEDGQGGLYVRLGRQGGSDAPLSDPFDVSLMMEDTDYWYFNGESYYTVAVEGLDVSTAVMSKLQSMYPDATFNLRTPIEQEPGRRPAMLWDGGFMSFGEFTRIIPVGSSKAIALRIPSFYEGEEFLPMCQVFNNDGELYVSLFFVSETSAVLCWNGQDVYQAKPTSASEDWCTTLGNSLVTQLNNLFGTEQFSFVEDVPRAVTQPDIVLSWT